MKTFPNRTDLGLALAALAAGFVFFASLDRLWPLAELDLNVPGRVLRADAAAFLESRGYDLGGYRSSSVLTLDGEALDYLQRAFGEERTQTWIAEGRPLLRYRVTFKRPGEQRTYRVELHPAAGVVGWRRSIEEDEPGPALTEAEARELARDALARGLGIDLTGWTEKGASTGRLPERTDHRFAFERTLSEDPELRERLFATVAGDEVVSTGAALVVPGPASRAARAAEAPGRAMETIGFALLGAAALGAFWVFLTRLRSGAVRLGRAVFWPVVIFGCLLGTYALQRGALFLNWEPLWPKWISTLQYLVYRSMDEVWMLVVLLAVIAAGDALDRESGAGRGASLWRLRRGALLDPGVAAASARGFMVGMLCGVVMAASVVGLERLAGAWTAIQPRGFFFYPINSASASAVTLLFFLNVALLEELGYRFFAGTWLLWWTRRAWIAVVVPAVIYGLTHTRLDFLPPAEPFWGRAVVMTLVGCVWGWAFLRYDALTVVLSHYTADLFIFNWPRLASGQPAVTTAAALTIVVPLVPACLWLLGRIAAARPGGVARRT